MHYLLTVSGEDQIGLVESLAGAIESLGGNWLQSRLCRLEGQFAGIVTVAFESEPSNLPDTVKTLQCSWKPMSGTSSDSAKLQQATISILAADRPGIVKQISHVLASGGANVEEIESRVVSAPFSGEQMFEALYRISVDTGVDRDALRKGLESLAEELMCELQYSES